MSYSLSNPTELPLLNKYVILEEISKWTNRKTISLVLNNKTQTKYLMIKYLSWSDIEINEIRFLSSLPLSCNLIHCYEIIIDDKNNTYYCIIDYAEKLTLHHHLIENYSSRHCPESEIWNYLVQMLYAVYPWHKNNIIHRNIKNSNFFLFEDHLIKLGGFKWCQYKKEQNSLSHLPESLNYFNVAPEIINKEIYDNTSDIWSIGACVYEMLFPCEDYNQIDSYSKLWKGNQNMIFDKQYSMDLLNILHLMWNPDKTKRANVESLLKNPVILKNVYNPVRYIDIWSFGESWLGEEIPVVHSECYFDYNKSVQLQWLNKCIRRERYLTGCPMNIWNGRCADNMNTGNNVSNPNISSNYEMKNRENIKNNNNKENKDNVIEGRSGKIIQNTTTTNNGRNQSMDTKKKRVHIDKNQCQNKKNIEINNIKKIVQLSGWAKKITNNNSANLGLEKRMDSQFICFSTSHKSNAKIRVDYNSFDKGNYGNPLDKTKKK